MCDRSKTLAKTGPRISLIMDNTCGLKYEKRINLCSPYPTRSPLLLKTCTSCYLSWDRLINAPVINMAFSLSCPWEDLSTYPLKINIPDQWSAQTPATSSYSHPAPSENKPQLVRFDFNSCWARGARLNLSPDLGLHSICPLTAHPLLSLSKQSPRRVSANAWTAAP